MAQAGESFITSPTLPARPIPTVCRVSTGFMPAIHHPERVAAYLRIERFPRKTKATAAEAFAYAARALWYRQRRATEKRRRMEILSSPHWLQAAE
jgi:hypothetical protein